MKGGGIGVMNGGGYRRVTVYFFTPQAFSYLREEVRQFLGQPIRARIKGTTVQRSSGMPKSKHIPFTMQYNGAPPQVTTN